MKDHKLLSQIHKQSYSLLFLLLLSAIVSGFDPILTSTDTPINSDDADLYLTGLAEEPYTNIIDWRLNGISIASLNLPFEAHAESATKAKDYSTNNNDAVVNGALFKPTDGYDSKGAYYFTANTGITTTQPIDVSKYTVSLWIKPEAVTGYRNLIYVPESKRYFSIANGVCSWTETIWSCTKKAPPINAWTHITITSEGNVYQNGIYDGKIKVLPLTGIVTLGDRDQSTWDFKGFIDDVKIYNRVLSPQQIEQIAQKQQHILVAEETQLNDVWSAAVTNNDGTEDTETLVSNAITIGINSFTPVLVSSDGDVVKDTSNLLLTQLAQPPLKNIIDWRLNGISIALLNLPFEAHAESATKAKDYSTNKNDAVVNGALFKPTDGYDSKGAYYFTANTGITTTQPIDVSKYTVSLWIKPEAVTGYRNLIYVPESKRYFSIANGVCSWTETIWSCTKKAPPINAWTHITITSEGNVYQNGIYDGKIKVLPLTGIVTLGDRDQSTWDFKGFIDEVKIYNRVLSPEQISQLAVGKEDVLVHQETKEGDIWKALVSIQDQNKEILSVETNQLEITKSTCMQYDWITMDSPFGSKTIKRMWGASANSVYLLASDNVIHYDGKESSLMDHPPNDVLRDLAVISDNHVYTVGNNAVVNHFDGTSWEKIETGTGNKLRSVWVNSPTDIFVGPENNNILHYNGFAWEEMDVGASTIYDLWGSSPNDIYGTRGDGSILRYNGATWTVSYTVEGYQHFSLQKIWGSSKDDIFVVGSKEINGIDKGMIIHYDGENWEEMNVDVKGELFDVWGTSPENVYVTGKGGVLLHYNGNTWIKITTPISSDLRSIWGSSLNDIYAAGDDGLVLHYTCI